MAAAQKLEESGHFKEAAAALNGLLSQAGLSEADRKAIGFELDRLDRIRLDFPFDENALFEELKAGVAGLTRQEFDKWVKEGRFDSRVIDGRTLFMASSLSNLFFRYPELELRRTPPKSRKTVEAARWETVAAIRTAARQSGQPYVLPKKFEATMSVWLKPGAATSGQEVQAWLPVPRTYPFQTGFEIVSSKPSISQLAPERSPIRSAFFEQRAGKDGEARFEITYRYTVYGVSFDLDPARAKLPEPGSPMAAFTHEAPHIVFTPELRELARKIAGDEKNPLLRARRYYNWIGENIKYSYSIEYSTIRNISDYCRTKRYGDCGQEALLFITLCRMDGIPARWQSGWNLFPGVKTIHDWTEVYLEPWGWFPVDPYMGIRATRYYTTLTSQQRREIRDFYFGGLDQYRMIANSDHCQELSPAKKGYRSDTVDFQRGEIDVAGKNVYFNRSGFNLDYKEVVP